MPFYSNGDFSVIIAPDGSIQVSEGDTLSKYSAAIHGDFRHVHEFGREDASGTIRPVENVDLIFAGETLYHIPTVRDRGRFGDRPDPITPSVEPDPVPATDRPRPSRRKRKRMLRKTVRENYDVSEEALDWVGDNWDTALDLMESGVSIVEVLGGVSMTVAGTTSFVVGVIIGPIAAVLDVLSAWDVSKRTYALRGMAYTVTAWTFGDPLPDRSRAIRRDWEKWGEDVREYDRAWERMQDRTLKRLRGIMADEDLTKEQLQAAFRIHSGDDPQELCEKLLEGAASRIDPPNRQAFENDIYRVRYPD